MGSRVALQTQHEQIRKDLNLKLKHKNCGEDEPGEIVMVGLQGIAAGNHTSGSSKRITPEV